MGAMREKIAVAVSGGVDSAVTAYLLRQAGYDPLCVSFLMHGAAGAEDPTERAAAVCDALGVPFFAIDARAEFARCVIADFVDEYIGGRTPNPCVTCNRTVKFPTLVSYADTVGVSRIATGHYARIARCGDRYTVRRAADDTKDQSYMLWALPQETLARLTLPLGDYTKSEIRALAAQIDLPNAKARDSQDICFIPDGDYAAFLKAAGVPLPGGTFVSEDGDVLGAARNQACYTVGQRRGLGIALGQNMYVTARCAAENKTVISPRDPYAKTVYGVRVNYLAAAPGDLDSPRHLTVRLRYTRAEHACVAAADGDRLTVRLDTPCRAPAAGQSLVLYDGDTVVAGAIITEWEA